MLNIQLNNWLGLQRHYQNWENSFLQAIWILQINALFYVKTNFIFIQITPKPALSLQTIHLRSLILNPRVIQKNSNLGKWADITGWFIPRWRVCSQRGWIVHTLDFDNWGSAKWAKGAAKIANRESKCKSFRHVYIASP